MRRFFLFITSHPVIVLWVAGVVAFVFGGLIFGLKRETSPDAFIPKDHPALERKKQVEEDFGVREPIAIVVIRDGPGGIFSPPTLRLIRDLSAAIQALPSVESEDVLSLATESGVFFEEGVPGFEPLMKEIPDTPEALEALRQDVLEYELYRGTLVAADGSAACIIIRSRDGQDDDDLYREIGELVAEFPVEDEWLGVAGEAAVRAHMGVAVSDDALRMNFIAPVVMALLIVLAYRTARGTILPLSVIGGSAALALGLMSALGVPVFIVTNGIFVIIMALGVADSVHLLGQYYEEQLNPRGRNKREIIVDACMALWYPLLVTTLTDLAGFFALFLVGILPPIQHFGLFTCVGVIGALFYSYTVVPAGLMILPLDSGRIFRKTESRNEVAHDAVGRLLARLASFTIRNRRRVLVAWAVLLMGLGWAATGLYVNDARLLAFKDQHPLVEASREINDRFDGTSHLNIVVNTQEEGGILRPEMLQRIADLEAFTESLPHVGGTHSPAGWVKRAHQKMHDEDPAYFAIPEDESDTRFYLDVLSIPTSPMAQLLLEVTDRTYARANLIVRMTSSEFIHQREVIERLERYLDEKFSDGTVTTTLAGRVDLDYHWIKVVRTSHVRSIGFSLVCVLLLTGLMFRSALAGVLCGVSVGVAVLVNYAVMGIADIPLGVGTSMFASIAIGAGVDFPIHILDRLRASFRRGATDAHEVVRETLSITGRAVFFTAMVVMIGFLLLCVSEFRTLNRFGLLIGLGMAVTFVTSVSLLPALVASLRPRFLAWPTRPPTPEA